VSKVFKDFNYNWLARELEINLPQELNFEHEAANLNKCRLLLKDMIDSGDLALPEVAESSKRVLVMSFEEVSSDNKFKARSLN
jgi:aarF domain-containing kinase